MSNIPQDIMEAVEHFSVNYTVPDPAEVRESVAQLILDERNRCERLAIDRSKSLYATAKKQKLETDEGLFVSAAWECDDLAKAIRGETT